MLGRFETAGGRNLFRIPSEVSVQVFLELSDGFQSGYLFVLYGRPFIASLSTIRFRERANSFAGCVAALHRDNFRDVRVSNARIVNRRVTVELKR